MSTPQTPPGSVQSPIAKSLVQQKPGGVIPGFTRVTDHVQHRLVMSIQGVQKTGKTSFGLSGPGPVALLNLDLGDEGVVQKFIDKKAIYKNDYRAKRRMTRDDYTLLWEKLKTDYYNCLDSTILKTVIFDTASDGWELCRLARHGKLSQVLPRDYDVVNFEFKEMIKEALHSDKNVLFLHQVKDEYINDKSTGNKIMAGFKKMPFEVQIVLQTITYDEKDKSGFSRRVFGGRIMDCRQDPLIIGMDFMEDDFMFPKVATAIFPDTTEKDWE